MGFPVTVLTTQLPFDVSDLRVQIQDSTFHTFGEQIATRLCFVIIKSDAVLRSLLQADLSTLILSKLSFLTNTICHENSLHGAHKPWRRTKPLHILNVSIRSTIRHQVADLNERKPCFFSHNNIVQLGRTIAYNQVTTHIRGEIIPMAWWIWRYWWQEK